MIQSDASPIFLASASRVRSDLLRAAGVMFEVDIAAIDEAPLKRAHRSDGAPAAAAALAERKAQQVALRHPGALVVGADQILECDGQWFDKPRDTSEARRTLRALRGREHKLIGAVCVVRDDTTLWRHDSETRLRMWDFSDDFIDAYLQRIGPAALDSVGGYQLEGLGAQLFASVDGDYFSILGLALLPLLQFLRDQGAVSA